MELRLQHAYPHSAKVQLSLECLSYLCRVKEWLLAQDKLHTVVAVLLVIWAGLAVHLWRLTRRVERLERQLPKESP